MLECEHGQLARACNICEYEREIAELRARVKELEAALKRETNDYIEASCSLAIERDEVRAENKRLAALNDMFPQEIARLEDRVSAEYEAERADDRARIKELEAERDADRKREYGYSQQTVDALTVERDKLEAENKRLKWLTAHEKP